MTYSSTWTATDQVPQRAVADGRIGRFGTVDPTTGGETERHSLSWEYQRDGWQFASYLIDYRLDLFSNFTYFLEDPVNGDQFEQNDRRKVYGFDTRHVRDLRTLGVDGHFAFGAQLRHDDIDTVGLYATRARERLATVREDRIGLSALGVYGEIGHRWSESVRTVAGARIDHQRANIGNGAFHDTLVSPKFSLVLGPWAETEYFAGVGRGFHSNDARGDPAALLAPGWGVDVGLRTNFISRTQVALAAFVLRLESELVYVGDAGNTEPNSESERYGLELSLVHTPTRWLILDADLAWTRARFVGSGVADAIPNAVPRVASFGATVSGAGRWNGGLRVRHLGSAPLVEDSSARSSATTLVNAQIRYGLSDSWSVTLAGFNLFDRRANDIAYFYSSRLPAEAAAVDDFHIHPVEPRHIRIGISLTF